MIAFSWIKMKPEAYPIVIPFARWHVATNNEVFTNQPRKY